MPTATVQRLCANRQRIIVREMWAALIFSLLCEINCIIVSRFWYEFPDHEWKNPRRHLNLSFNLSILKSFIPTFSRYADLAVRELATHDDDGSDFDVIKYISRWVYRTNSGEWFSTSKYTEMLSWSKFVFILWMFSDIFVDQPRFSMSTASTYRTMKKSSPASISESIHQFHRRCRPPLILFII